MHSTYPNDPYITGQRVITPPNLYQSKITVRYRVVVHDARPAKAGIAPSSERTFSCVKLIKSLFFKNDMEGEFWCRRGFPYARQSVLGCRSFTYALYASLFFFSLFFWFLQLFIFLRMTQAAHTVGWQTFHDHD